MASERLAAVLARVISDGELTEALAGQAALAAGVGGLGAVVATTAGTAETIWSSGPTNTSLTALQLTLGEGPSVDASRHGVLVLEPDLVNR